MFFRIIKVVAKLFSIACIAQIIREKLTISLYTWQHNFKAQVKKFIQISLLASLAVILFSLGLRFLLHGLACWLNLVLASTYLGFFIIAIFCFFMVLLLVFMLRSKMNNQEEEKEEEEEISDLQ